MADKKISELTALTSTASGDLFVIVDDSATETKYVTRSNIFGQDLSDSDSPSFAGLTVDTDTLYVSSSNNRVGIGTTSPGAAVHLKNGSSGATAFGFSDFYLEGSSVTGLNFLHADANAAGIYWSTPSDNLGAEIRWKYTDNEFKIGARSTNGFMSFYSGNTESMRIDSSGNILIGTSVTGASTIRVVGLPTSSAGLSSGDVWNDSGTLKIV